MPVIIDLREDIKQYIQNHDLLRKWKKAKRLFENNPSHPSLQVKKMQGKPGKFPFWEARIDLFWRMSFQKEKEGIRLCRLGPHDEVVKNKP